MVCQMAMILTLFQFAVIHILRLYWTILQIKQKGPEDHQCITRQVSHPLKCLLLDYDLVFHGYNITNIG